MSFAARDRMSIFGALRPRGRQTLSRAVVSTYSLDLVAMLGLVLALGGDAEAEFETSPLGLVRAFDRVRGRLLVIHQAGRVVAPRAHRSVLPLLDSMLRAVAADERRESWHPKVAFVRCEEDGRAEWRVWIGSRNLTGSTDLEAGLLLVSGAGRGARRLPGVAEMASGLLVEAEWAPEELAELRGASWRAPPGVAVREILWRRPGTKSPFLRPTFMARADAACAVSPFLDRTGLGRVRDAAGRPVELLTTRLAGGGCSGVEGFRFRMAAAPLPETEVVVEEQVEEPAGDFTDPPATGVHAKLFAARRGARTALLIGSANLTWRGLDGPNAEVGAILDVSDGALAASLFDFVAGHMELGELPEDPEAEALERERLLLDGVVARLLQRRMTLRADASGLRLAIHGGVDDLLDEADLSASPFLEPEGWVSWPRGADFVQLMARAPQIADQTSLVVLRARGRGDPVAERRWVQRLEVDGLDEERRDRALLARYVGAHRFRDWLRTLLDGVDATGGRRWFEPGEGTTGREAGSLLPDAFTLETMLAGWARDPDEFEARVGRMTDMLAAFEEAFAALPDPAQREAALRDLEEVRPFLSALSEVVGTTSR